MNKKRFLNSILLTVVYFVLALLSYGLANLLATVIMSVAFFVYVSVIIDKHIKSFSYYYFFAILVLGWGFFARYIFLGLGIVTWGGEAYIPLLDLPEYHELTALYILISIVFFAIGKSIAGKKKDSIKLNEDILIESYKSTASNFNFWQLLAFVIYIFVFVYSRINLRFSDDVSFGVYDNIVRTVNSFCEFIAYLSFAKYILFKSKRSLLLSMFILLPNTILAILAAWKGPIIILIISLLILINSIKKVKRYKIIQTFFLLLLLFGILYPTISLYRVNLATTGIKQEINYDTIMEFYDKHSMLRYLSDRFCNYDNDYYVLNLPSSTIDQFLSIVGREDERLLSGLVPRVIYPEKKPVGIGLEITHYIYGYPSYVYNNNSMSFIGTVWISYGMIGIIVFSFVLGFSFKRLETLNGNSFYSLGEYMMYGQCWMNIARNGIAPGILGLISVFIMIKVVGTFNGVLKNTEKI